jgi:hypothetical protein
LGALAAGGGCVLLFFFPAILLAGYLPAMLWIAGVPLLWSDAWILFTMRKKASETAISYAQREEQIETKYLNGKLKIGATLAIVSGAIGLSGFGYAGLYGVLYEVLTESTQLLGAFLAPTRIGVSLIALAGGGYIWHNIRDKVRIKRIPAIVGGICATLSSPILGLAGLILIAVGPKRLPSDQGGN